MSDALWKALNIRAFGLIYVLLYEDDNYSISTVRQSAPQTATTIKITSLQQVFPLSNSSLALSFTYARRALCIVVYLPRVHSVALVFIQRFLGFFAGFTF